MNGVLVDADLEKNYIPPGKLWRQRSIFAGARAHLRMENVFREMPHFVIIHSYDASEVPYPACGKPFKFVLGSLIERSNGHRFLGQELGVASAGF